jgi:hypothetical protein
MDTSTDHLPLPQMAGKDHRDRAMELAIRTLNYLGTHDDSSLVRRAAAIEAWISLGSIPKGAVAVDEPALQPSEARR